MDPLAIVGADDVGDQVIAILEQLRERARGLRDYAGELLDRVEGMRDLVMSLSSEGLARRELEERLAVLEAERDVLARQLGKVRRESEEELALARERLKGLETELSLAARQGTAAVGQGQVGAEAREAGADIDQPVVETLGARARREALKSRSPRTLPDPRLPRFPRSEGAGGWDAGPEEGRGASAGLSGLLDDVEGREPSPSAEADPFLGLLDSPWSEPAAALDDDPRRTPRAGDEIPELPDGLFQLDDGPTEGGASLDAGPGGGAEPPSLEALLATYLKE